MCSYPNCITVSVSKYWLAAKVEVKLFFEKLQVLP